MLSALSLSSLRSAVKNYLYVYVFFKFETKAFAVYTKMLFLLVVKRKENLDQETWKYFENFRTVHFAEPVAYSLTYKSYKSKYGDVHCIYYIFNFVYKYSLHGISQNRLKKFCCYSKTVFVHLAQLFWRICLQSDFHCIILIILETKKKSSCLVRSLTSDLVISMAASSLWISISGCLNIPRFNSLLTTLLLLPSCDT